jgi:hypothetical protein
MFICQKLDARFFFYLVGIEVFSKLFHLMCHLFKSDKNKQDAASKVFRESLCIFQYGSTQFYKKATHDE